MSVCNVPTVCNEAKKWHWVFVTQEKAENAHMEMVVVVRDQLIQQ